jgi:protein-S-isoprenylcysteine O-methyltransferase Ste14
MQQELERPSLRRSWAYQTRVPITAIVLVGTWIYAAFSSPVIPEGSIAAWLTDVAGWITFLGGVLLRVWATLWIGGRKRTTLVDDGPYRLCRNPLYLGTFGMGIGLGLLLKDPVFAAGLLLILALYLWFVVPAEESYMRSRHPGEYDQFCARVPRWMPRIGLLRRDEIFRQVADRGALYRECLRMVCWILLPVLAEFTYHRSWWSAFPRLG